MTTYQRWILPWMHLNEQDVAQIAAYFEVGLSWSQAMALLDTEPVDERDELGEAGA